MVERTEKRKKTFAEKTADTWRGFLKFMYNKETGHIMGRDCTSWAKIWIFYLIYYSCLAAFFAALLAIFLQTLDKPGQGGPKLTQFLDKGPGLALVFPTGISYSKSSNESFTKDIKKFLEGLENPNIGTNYCPLTATGYTGNVPCRFNQSLFGPCDGVKDPSYGFKSGAPCQFVHINRVFNWVPKNYGSSFLTLSCSFKSGEGTINVHPQGFLISAFPYKGQSFYRTPPVAVQVKPKDSSKVRVRCFLRGEGIKTAEYFDHKRGFANADFTVTVT